MTSLQDFVATAVVTAGCGGAPTNREKAMRALRVFVAKFRRADERSALLAARVALRDVRHDGSIPNMLLAEIDSRLATLARRGRAGPRRRGS